MSRYTHEVQVTNLKTGKPKRYTVAYGFDPPLSEYFIQVMPQYPVEGDDDEEQCFLWEGNRTTGKTNSEMLQLFMIFEVPDEHIQALAMDLPF